MEPKFQASFKEILGNELSYMIKQHEKLFTEEKHWFEKLNILHIKRTGVAGYLGTEEVKIIDNIC